MKNLLLLIAVTFSLNIIGQVPNYVPTNGLVGWWPFNGNANDESGNSNNGIVNGATITTDRNGNPNSAYYFSSISCATYIDAQINTSSINGELTISFWVNRTDVGCISPRIIKFYAPSDGAGTHTFDWNNNSSNPSMAFVTSTTNSPFYQYNNIANGTWAFIVYTNDGINAKLYQNGQLLSTNISSGIVTLAGNANFGRMTNPAFDAFNGEIDDIGIWSRALTQCEVNQLYSSQVYSNTGTDVQAACNTYTWIDANTYTTSNNTATHTLTNAAGCDSVVTLNLTINSNTGTDIQTACNTYTWIDGMTYSSSNNTATYLMQNSSGCDSLVTLDLTMNNSSSSTLNESAMDSYTLNGQTYSQSGTYTQVIPNAEGCDSTITLNLTMNYTGIDDLKENLFSVFPNPASTQISVKADVSLVGSVYTIFDNVGKVVLSGKITSENTIIELDNLSGGIYLFSIGGNMNQTFKVIKE